MKSLIINADDVGISGAVNEAVAACFKENIITGVSVMSCGRGFQEAIYMLRDLDKTEVGVHLTLTGGFLPATPDRFLINSLLGKKGHFVRGYKELALRLLMGRIDIEEIYLELSHQVNHIRKEGFKITHLDSHEHVHLFPDVLKVVLRLAVEFNIPYVRLPLEDSKVIWKEFSVKDFSRYMVLKMFAKRSKDRIDYINSRCNDYFLGHFHSGRIKDDVLAYMVDNLRNGVTELAVHPAVLSEDFDKEFPWYKNGQHELNILLGGQWRKRLESAGVKLLTHKEAAERVL